MSNLFDELLVRQDAIQLLLGNDVQGMDDVQRVAFIRDMTLAGTSELYELLDTVQWKPWASGYEGAPIDHDEFRKEFSDVLIFMLNLALAAGLTGDQIYAGISTKIKINAERAKSKYDGNWAAKRSTVDGKPGTIPA